MWSAACYISAVTRCLLGLTGQSLLRRVLVDFFVLDGDEEAKRGNLKLNILDRFIIKEKMLSSILTA